MYLVSKSSMKTSAYRHELLLPIEDPFFWSIFLPLKQKLFRVSIRCKYLMITRVGMLESVCFSRALATEFIPSEFGMFVNKDFTSIVTRIVFSGKLVIVSILLMNSIFVVA